MDHPSSEQRVDDAWRNERTYLLGLADRMLRGRADAEDVVQDAFGRLARVDVDAIDDLRAWLAVVVRRLCLDLLGSAHARRESAGLLDADRPTLGGTTVDPADRATLDDQVQLALAVVLDRLSPAERTSFVLHDVFGFPFEAVGGLVGRTPAACRQLASRARRSIQADTGAGDAEVEVAQHRLVAERFIAACAGGDLDELMAVLDPEVVGDGTTLEGAPLLQAEGAEAIARRLLGFFGPGKGRLLIPLPLEEAPGVVALEGGQVVAVVRLDATDGLIDHVHAVVCR